MAKLLERNHSTAQFDKYHGGWCILGLLPHHLSRFKKLKLQTRPKHESYSKYGPKTGLRESDYDEEYEARKRNSSCNALVCIRQSISSHTSTEGSLIVQPRLKRTYAVHHLEPSSNYLGDQKVDHCKTEKALQESKHWTEQEDFDHDDGDEYQSSKICEDFFDAYKIDKKLFMKNTRKSDADRCDRVGESQKKVTLRRSGSYPAANEFGNRYGTLQPSKLEDKLSEVWPSGSSTSTASPLSSSSPSSSTTSSSSHRSVNFKLLRSCSVLSKSPLDRSGEGKHRRTLSLDGSKERYTQLLENGFRRELKLSPSNSLKLSNEDGVDNNISDLSMLRKAHSMHEALQEERLGSIELPKEFSRSETVMSGNYFHEQSVSEVNKDEPGTSGMQNSACRVSEDTFQENVSRAKDIVDLTDLQNALKQLVNLSTMEDLNGFQDDLEDQLLSHLVNELMYDIYEDCDAYYWPASLGSKCSVYPQPLTEDQVSRKILSRIQELRGFIFEASNDVKSVTALDIVNSYGWMNLRVDAECLGLALEEMFFDELLEELICE